ncbi:MAG: HD domain-containing protein [Candidatus Bipolaricaulis sp.]|nr:HD domain-containing protein [Candidatus Bipolaricaulis sp.]
MSLHPPGGIIRAWSAARTRAASSQGERLGREERSNPARPDRRIRRGTPSKGRGREAVRPGVHRRLPLRAHPARRPLRGPAEAEGLDRELSVAACLLHDVAYFIPGEHEDWWDNHGRVGAKISRPILLDAGFSAEEMNAMCHAIAVHVDGKSDDGQPDGPLDDLVSDADNVDRFSALRIVLWCMTEKDNLAKMAGMLRERLTRLYKYRDTNPLKTNAGRELFAERVALQIPLFEAILHDVEITRRPEI